MGPTLRDKIVYIWIFSNS